MGKSVVFNYLTGRYAEVSNFPGTTVEVNSGNWQGQRIIDSPGIYGLNNSNDEERLAAEAMTSADIIVNVVDATRLRRDLYLTLALVGRKPLLVVLNMMDEVHSQGLKIDPGLLEEHLGVPVIAATAVTGAGLTQLQALLNSWVCLEPQQLQNLVPRRPLGSARKEASRLAEAAMGEGVGDTPTTIDILLTRPIPGMLVLASVLGLIYWLVGGLVAQNLVGFTEGVVMSGWLVPGIVKILSRLLPLGLFQAMLIGEFGVLTMALSYGLGLLMPLVFSFYVLLALLEDSGYLPRVAVLLDNVFAPLGLNGKGAIPLILGFGCVTMAVISTRMLSTRRERVILTVLMGLAVPCSAQTGVILVMLVPLGPAWLLAYASVMLAVFLAAGRLLHKLMPGDYPGLFLEMPRLRLPRARNVLRKALTRAAAFLKDALPLFALGSLLITAFSHLGILHWLQQALAPLVRGWLDLPGEAVNAFLMGMIRRDFGAAGLLALNLTPSATFVALVVMSLFVPCLATVLVAIREHGLKLGLTMWLGCLAIALLVGGLVAMLV